MRYFSDREFGEPARTITEISASVWLRLAQLIEERVENCSFAGRFPERCQDYPFEPGVICGVHILRLETALKSEIPALAEIEQNWRDSGGDGPYGRFAHLGKRIWQMSQVEQPPISVIMDIIEFCWRSVSKPEFGYYHSFFQHHHLRFDQETGQGEFREEVNRIFQRNGVAFTLTERGQIERVIPEPISSLVRYSDFQTGDQELDGLLETACRQFVMPEESERRDGLEKLWDAWERIKTIEDADKKTGAAKMLDRLASGAQPKFRKFLEDEATALTAAGNAFRIRHSETTQERLSRVVQVDYLFARMFVLIHAILSTIGAVIPDAQSEL